MVKKAFPITETLYLGYSFVFLFNNANSHFVYIKNALPAKNMNMGARKKQPVLRNGWFDQNNNRIIYR